jgi:FdhD protein
VEGSSFEDKFLVTTGRINHEMVHKAAVCGIRVVASKAPPTDKGIELAERLGVTLAGFVRNRRLNVYSHPEIWRRDS